MVAGAAAANVDGMGAGQQNSRETVIIVVIMCTLYFCMNMIGMSQSS